MGLLDIFKKSDTPSSTPLNPTIGICRATRGDLGIWVAWSSGLPTEAYRVVVTAYSQYRQTAEVPFTFTFAPGLSQPSTFYVVTPYEFKEFMRGKNRATSGHVTFELILENSQTVSTQIPLEDVLQCFLGKGAHAPKFATEVPGLVDVDTPAVAALKTSDLKRHSDEAKRVLEEKRKKAEEEAKAKEAARIEAEKKAAEAKAKADAAAKAAAAAKSAGGGGAAAAGAEAGPTLAPCKVAIIYGTSTGNTGNVAEMIKGELSDLNPPCKSITDIRPSDLPNAEILVLGVPTWHIGEMQDDWAAVLGDVGAQNYSGKKVAIFGLGDGKGYPETYVDAMQELWEKFEKKGATLVGLWPTSGYEFSKSKAIKDGKFLGLVIDVENQDNMTDDRVKRWTAQIRKELGL